MEHKKKTTIDTTNFHEEFSLERLEDLSAYKVADGYDNVMGWKVVANDELELGKVRGLIASKELERVLYLDIEITESIAKDKNMESHLYVLVPIGLARLKHDEKIVGVDAIDAEAFVSYPHYDGKEVHMDYEYLLHEYYAEHPKIHLEPFEGRTAKYYDHDLLYNQTTVYGNQTIGF
jgi:hypothetical protein